MNEPIAVPKWAGLIVVGILAYVFLNNHFPSREEEELKHKAVEDRLHVLVQDSKQKDSELENKIVRLADLISDHAKQPSHAGTSQLIAEHTLRISNLEDNHKAVVTKLEINENLLREIKARLDNAKSR